MAKSKKSKGRIDKVDFGGVESRVLVPEGEYKVKPVEVEKEDGDEHPYYAWKFEITAGKYKGKPLYLNTSLSPKALWNLKSLLETMGIEVPDGPMELDLDEIIENGPEFGAVVEHESYNGKKQARIVDYVSAEDVDEDGAGGDDSDSGASDKPSEEDVMAMDEGELEEVIEAFGLEVDLDKIKNLKKKRTAVWEALESAESSDDDEDDEDDEKSNKKSKKKDEDDEDEEEEGEDNDEEEEDENEEDDEELSEDAVNEMGKPELKALVKKHKLKVELEGTTAKQRRLVIKALQKKELI